jgi:hypothetical protein
MNFLVVEFGDNDFGHYLREALRDIIDQCGGVDFCPITAKKYIIEYVVMRSKLNKILRGYDKEINDESTREYLSRMRVTFRDKLPTWDIEGQNFIDHDGGSVYYDINLDQVGSF